MLNPGSTFLLLVLTSFLCLPMTKQARASATLQQQIELFIPGNSTTEQAARGYVSGQIQYLIDVLVRDHRVDRRSTKKAVRLIRELIETSCLRYPQEYANFRDLFKQGAFNATTTTAVYALLLEYFKIPYQIEADFWSLNLVADPDRHAIALHPPIKQLMVTPREQAFVRDYAQLLEAMQWISSGEVEQSPQQLFQQYYLGTSKRLTLPELAGFLHYQQAMAAYRNSNYELALKHLDDAQAVAPRPVMDVLRNATLFQLATSEDLGSQQSLDYLLELRRSRSSDLFDQEIIRRFRNVAERSLSTIGSPAELDGYFDFLSGKLTYDPEFSRILSEIYFYYKSRYHTKGNEPVVVKSYVDSLYSYRPDDASVQDVLAGMVAWTIRQDRNFDTGLQRLDRVFRQYPFLRNHNYFQDLDLFYRAERIRLTYNNDQLNLGFEYFQEFRRLLQEYGTTPRYQSWVLTAYLATSNYYYRWNDFNQARLILEEAYRICPSDPYLAHRIHLLRNLVAN